MTEQATIDQRGLKLPKVLKKDVLELANQKLSSRLDGAYLGAYWLPRKNLCLGFTAGRMISKYILGIERGERYYDRTAERTVAGEISHLLLHRWKGGGFETALRSCTILDFRSGIFF